LMSDRYPPPQKLVELPFSDASAIALCHHWMTA